ncbi:cytochrome P450 [Streptomyces luteireticuli]|uniref:cytochrome P450 n=1 Tax=Streptomyces luteireticuli TaxID=173858 RepID=UPI00355643B1
MSEAVSTEKCTKAPPFPQDRTCPYQPPPGYAEFRDQGAAVKGTLYDGSSVWLVTGYRAARELLSGGHLSADRQNPGYPIVSPRMEGIRHQPPSFVGMDAPQHTRHRRMLMNEFSVHRVAALRPVIETIVDEHIEAMLGQGGPLDLVPAFSLPVPSRVICEILGVPYADHAFFQETSRNLIQADSPEQALEAAGELGAYLERLIGDLLAEPGPGLLGRLARDQVAHGELAPHELVMNALMVLIAGHETTASMITLSVITLLHHPSQLEALRADPALATRAVEELLRYLSIADIAGTRVAATDIEVGGKHIREGEPVVVVHSLANRDATVFPDPDRFDIRRGDRRHMAFGFGVHQCLGQNLARAELEIALPALFGRLPGLRLAVDLDRVVPRDGGTVQGVNTLPITWGSGT